MKKDISTPITNEEIKDALFSIPNNKTPSPDEFSAMFFKTGWSIVGEDFLEAIKGFFQMNSMPKCVNATTLVLIPKVENPSSMEDYRLISCCNVIYKTISKVLANRLRRALEHIIGNFQSDFIPGRNIVDAILLSQELMHNYHLKNGPPWCAIKIDLRKAFDTILWDYIIDGLNLIGIPTIMVKCITTPHFSIKINGELQNWFNSSRGIQQGDSLSPYIFVLARKRLNGQFKEAINNPTYKFHWRCKANNITNICFTNDLLMFFHADTYSVGILK